MTSTDTVLSGQVYNFINPYLWVRLQGDWTSLGGQSRYKLTSAPRKAFCPSRTFENGQALETRHSVEGITVANYYLPGARTVPCVVDLHG